MPTYMYINPSFRPYEPHLHHLALGECETRLGVRAYLIFCEERGFSFKFASFSIPSKFFKWEKFSKCENLNFSFTFTCFLNSKHVFSKLQNFSFIEIPWDWPTYSGLHSHIFYLKLSKEISFSIETCFFMIPHENLNLWIHFQNFSFWSKFHLLHMKLVVWPTWQVFRF